MNEIYLDNSATTRIHDEVARLMSKVQDRYYGNPSSRHGKGLEAERIIKESRSAIKKTLGMQEGEIIFTSGGTEANNLAIKGIAYRYRRRGNHLITTAVEHPSVLYCYRHLEQEGFQVDYLPVDRYGCIKLSALDQLVNSNTVLVSIIHVNNETGTIQPVEEACTIIKKNNPNTFIHIDGVQSFGKLPVAPACRLADLFSCSAHKIHGPKGAGALWIRKGIMLQPLFHGGDQEQQIRPGTENVAAIAGFGLAAKIAHERLASTSRLLHNLKKTLVDGLAAAGIKISINGPPPAQAAPHIINLSFPGVKAEVLMHSLEQHRIYVSPGSACHSRRPEPSHVLQAMNLPPDLLGSALRFSFSGYNTEKEIEQVVGFTAKTAAELAGYGL